MHVVHEAMEVTAAALRKWQALEEEVHQPRLAAAHRSPQIEAPYGRRWALMADDAQQPSAQRLARVTGGDQAGAQCFQPPQDGELRRVGTEAALRNLTLVDLAQRPRACVIHPALSPWRARGGRGN